MQLNCLFARVIAFYFAASHAFCLIGGTNFALVYLYIYIYMGGGILALSTQMGIPLFAHMFLNPPKLIPVSLYAPPLYSSGYREAPGVCRITFYAVDAAQLLMAACDAKRKKAKKVTKQKREEFSTSALI